MREGTMAVMASNEVFRQWDDGGHAAPFIDRSTVRRPAIGSGGRLNNGRYHSGDNGGYLANGVRQRGNFRGKMAYTAKTKAADRHFWRYGRAALERWTAPPLEMFVGS